MTILQITLPDALARRARSEVLFTDGVSSGCWKRPCAARPDAG
ncbi:hypothetical protein [Variovorax ginsengisoli]|uniref:Uncharacterized protein n=1 Tax=Variovorax ginsengisoli TaxID=363844 RepID=A0ABT8SI47_9BURK|nr:hypothetical protein [Variovorax ginsengisoli]MDN8618031.1 hypothetical protein [Variovorax ginsengisoli]MDO1537201.1 hypothetical protein [Variovorax ginsengisoli]